VWLHVKSKLSLSSQRAKTLSAEQADRRERTDVIINHTLSLAQLSRSAEEQSVYWSVTGADCSCLLYRFLVCCLYSSIVKAGLI